MKVLNSKFPKFIFATLALFLMAIPVLADPPATAPSEATTAKPQPLVLVFPFKQMGDVAGHEWIGPAMREDLIADLQKSSLVRTRAMADPMVSSDTAKAIQVGKDAGAQMVMFGSYQVAGDKLRVTGQLLNVETGELVAPLKATGITLNVFDVEDSLAAEFQPALASLYGNGQPGPQVTYGPAGSGYYAANQNTPSTAVVPQYIPQTVYVNPPDYSYDNYPYNYYPYDYGFYPGVVYTSPFFFGGVSRFGVSRFGGHFGGRIGGGFGGRVGGFGGGHFGGGRR